MKLAITGKGGVGKTLLSALLAKQFAEEGYSVLAIDADPDTNLAASLGFPGADEITPISEMKELIEQRTGVQPGQPGSMFVLNPDVSDIPEKYSRLMNGVRVMVMGRVKRGGSGCYCAENTLLQSLLIHLLVGRKDVVVLDMAAGIEHLGRATARAVDKLLIVVEPGRKSLDTAFRIKKLAADIGINNIEVVANKIRNENDRRFVIDGLPGFKFAGFIPYDNALIDSEVACIPGAGSSPLIKQEIKNIFLKLIDDSADKNRK